MKLLEGSRRLKPLFCAAVFLALSACAATPGESASSQSDAVNEGNDGRAETGDGRGERVLERGDGGTVEAPPSSHVRIVASNTTSGNEQSYDPGHGIRILQAIQADIALMQEFNFGDNSEPALRGFVDTTFGPSFHFMRETNHAQIPNGIVSRFPIVASGIWDDPQTASREFAWARIDVPGDRDLWAVSVHFLTSSSARRQAEAAAIVARVRAEVPAGDFVVVGGDFNSGSRSESCLQTLSAIVKTSGPWPVDSNGNGDTSADRDDPYDWVLASPALDALHVPTVVGGQTFDNGLVFDSRTFRPLSAVAPVLSGDSASTNMQHMAVVRDFVLPN